MLAFICLSDLHVHVCSQLHYRSEIAEIRAKLNIAEELLQEDSDLRDECTAGVNNANSSNADGANRSNNNDNNNNDGANVSNDLCVAKEQCNHDMKNLKDQLDHNFNAMQAQM